MSTVLPHFFILFFKKKKYAHRSFLAYNDKKGKGDERMERLIKIGTVTDASRARRALLSEGIHTRLTKAESTNEGCVWGLKIIDTALPSAVRILKILGISHEIR